MDTATAKQLLQSGSLEELQDAALQLDLDDDEQQQDHDHQQQLVKLSILLHSKILSLLMEQAGNKPEEQSATATVLGRLWMRLNDPQKARGQLQKAVVLDENNFCALLLLSDVQSSPEDAVTSIEKAILILQRENLTCECAEAYSKLAAISENQGNFQQGIAILEKAIQECCTSADDNLSSKATLYGNLGRLKETTGDYEGAVEALQVARSAYETMHGPQHPQTQEIAYLLEMAESVL